MNLQRVHLQPLVEKVLEDFKAQADVKRVTLTNELPNLTAQADADRLQQVLGNLIGNAIKYGRNEGHVNLSGNLADDGMIAAHDKTTIGGIADDNLTGLAALIEVGGFAVTHGKIISEGTRPIE